MMACAKLAAITLAAVVSACALPAAAQVMCISNASTPLFAITETLAIPLQHRATLLSFPSVADAADRVPGGVQEMAIRSSSWCRTGLLMIVCFSWAAPCLQLL